MFSERDVERDLSDSQECSGLLRRRQVTEK